MFYPIEVAGVKRNLPLFPVNDSLQIAAFIMLGDAELTEACAREMIAKMPFSYDYLITAEAKGIPLVSEMARQLRAPAYFVARKRVKVYMGKALEVSVDSITTAGTQKLYLSENDVNMMRGKRVLIVDDVVSTGSSLSALETLVQEAGASIAGRACVLAEGDAAKRDDVFFLRPLPLFDAEGKEI